MASQFKPAKTVTNDTRSSKTDEDDLLAFMKPIAMKAAEMEVANIGIPFPTVFENIAGACRSRASP